MNDLKIKGVVTKILDSVSGVSKAGKDWNKQDFVIETGDKYPKMICFTLFGDKTDLLMNINVNDEVEVSFNLESREYEGRYFHNVNAWRINKSDQDKSSPNSPAQSLEIAKGKTLPDAFKGEQEEDDLPF